MQNNNNINQSPPLIKQISHSTGPKNIEAIILDTHPTFFIIRPNPKVTNINSILKIEKSNGRISEKNTDYLKEISQIQPLRSQYFTSFVGIMHIKDIPFLIFVDKVKQICMKDNFEIYEIQSVFFNNFESNFNYQNSKGKHIYEHISSIHKLLSTGFYFAYSFDITLSEQRRYENLNNGNSQMEFMWNNFLLKDLYAQKISKNWQIPIIQGYVGNFSLNLAGKKLDYFLISRRSRHNSGTRYNTRGVDDTGSVANFVQTEQIIYFNHFISSFIILRGSCPVFWTQQSYSSSIKLSRNYELSHIGFLRHFDNLVEEYGRVFCINLMSKTKQGEQMLTEQFETHLQQAYLNSNIDNVRYYYFDLLNNCKDKKFEKLNKLIAKTLPDISESLGYFILDQEKYNNNNLQKNQSKNQNQVEKQQQQEKGNEDDGDQEDDSILWKQSGVFRINCVDGLERTEIFLMKFSMKILSLQLLKMGIDVKSQALFRQEGVEALDNQGKNSHPFVILFKATWAEQSERIAFHYSNGSGNKIQQNNLKNKGFFNFIDQSLQNLQKSYGTSLEDQNKQESLDLLLGQHYSIQNTFDDHIKKQLTAQQNEYSHQQPISTFVASWNMNGKLPTKSAGQLTQNLFQFDGQDEPDIIVVGLQEMVKLNTKNVIMTNNEKMVDIWKFEIESALKILQKGKEDDEQYITIKERDLVGIFIAVFAKKKIKSFISKVDSCEVKTGLMGGTFGNKGACCVRLKIFDSTFCFTCVHLESGQGKSQERVASITEIHQKAFENNKNEFNFDQGGCDYSIFFGDMNFRIQPNQYVSVRQKMSEAVQLNKLGQLEEEQQIIQDLLTQDQLIKHQKQSSYFKKYIEHPIDFHPTYKYDIGTSIYDSSKKQRIPSWTDRILIWPSKELDYEQIFYKRVEQNESDHRPVITYYKLNARVIDQQKLQNVKKQIYQENEEAQISCHKKTSFQQHKQNGENNNNNNDVVGEQNENKNNNTNDTNENQIADYFFKESDQNEKEQEKKK